MRGMRVYVYVLEARDLLSDEDEDEDEDKDSSGGGGGGGGGGEGEGCLLIKYASVKLQVGKYKSRTRVVKKPPLNNPIVWNEEFVFRVHHDLLDDDEEEEELIISVFQHQEDHHHYGRLSFNASHGGGGGGGGGGDVLLGRVQIPLWSVIDEDKQTLPPTWFSLEKPTNGKSMPKDNSSAGKILLTISVHGEDNSPSTIHSFPAHSRGTGGPAEPSHEVRKSRSLSRRIPEGKHLVKKFASRLEKLFNKNDEAAKAESRNDDSSDLLGQTSDYEDCVDETSSNFNFEEALELMQSRDDEREMPADLQEILMDQTYVVSPNDLNKLLFMPNSQFRQDLAEQQGITDLQEGCWTWKSEERSCLTRVVTYTKAATKIVKAVKATEEQTYLKADGREFAVFVNVSTPDVPYGHSFTIELLYRMMPATELASGEETTRLIISWNINFNQSTMMKGMIEGGARQGLKESFELFADLMAQNVKLVDSTDLLLDKEQVLATLQKEYQSDWQLAIEYLGNFTVFSTICMVLYVLLHILLSGCGKPGLEFDGLDLPDTFGELITCGILVVHIERVFHMISHFVQARLQRGSDNGVKSEGDGWMLTVALIEVQDLASVDSSSFWDPYVVFTCNGRTRTSSVKLQTRDPQWNEILEFDAMEEPPSVLDVEVFDFDGPFDQATSLGHAEINFLKHTSTELADIWVTLEGKLAKASQTKLHLRIFLDNNNGVETIKEYLTKMEKEVGKKLSLRSPHRNSMFQKLFGLPPEEFLINDFACHLKRKMPLQGRLFLSARIVGFYANLFGHKTKFFFLWEDIDDVQVVPPTLSSVGSPSLVIVLRKGRGVDAKHGAKSQDGEGRLKFHFQSFVSFNVASRTIMALWRTRTLTPEQKAQLAEDQQDQDGSPVQLEDTASFFRVEDANLLKVVYSTEIPVNMNSLMQMFEGGNLEHKVMEKSGCLNYSTTPWEAVKADVDERHLSYKFNRHVSVFGGEVTSTQQKCLVDSGKGWTVDEVMTLHDVPFGDHFRVHLRYQIEMVSSSTSQCDVHLGIAWVKSTKFQQKITRNITDKFSCRLKDIFELVEREILLATPNDSPKMAELISSL